MVGQGYAASSLLLHLPKPGIVPQLLLLATLPARPCLLPSVPACALHARTAVRLRGGADESEGVRDMLTALPDEVRGMVGALDRAAALGNGDVESEVPSDMAARLDLPGSREPAQPESSHDAGASADELPTMDDPQSLREADALERALKKWKHGMEERAENPRISLSVRFLYHMAQAKSLTRCVWRCESLSHEMPRSPARARKADEEIFDQEHPKWTWMQQIEKFLNDSHLKLGEFEANVRQLNGTLHAQPLYLKLQVCDPFSLNQPGRLDSPASRFCRQHICLCLSPHVLADGPLCWISPFPAGLSCPLFPATLALFAAFAHPLTRSCFHATWRKTWTTTTTTTTTRPWPIPCGPRRSAVSSARAT